MKKAKLGVIILVAAMAMPSHAQDAANAAAPTGAAAAAPDGSAAPAAPADPAPPSDAAAASPAADASAPAPASDAPAADASAPAADASPAVSDAAAVPADAAAPATEATPRTPYKLYVGAGYDHANFSISDQGLMDKFGGQDFSTKLYHLRAGIRLFDVLGVEVQGGAKGDNGTDPGKVQMSNYYGVFVVPTGTVLDLFEVSAAIGFNRFSLQRGGAQETVSRLAYALNLELPVREISEALPDLRLTAGYKVYAAQTSERVYGFQLGLRFDFQI